MKILPYRVLRNEPGKFEETLSREGSVILDKNGEHLALVLDVAKESLESLIKLTSQIRAQLALTEIRESARERGLDKMSPEDIDAEIQAVRSKRAG
jgi:hypothetical protein